MLYVFPSITSTMILTSSLVYFFLFPLYISCDCNWRRCSSSWLDLYTFFSVHSSIILDAHFYLYLYFLIPHVHAHCIPYILLSSFLFSVFFHPHYRCTFLSISLSPSSPYTRTLYHLSPLLYITIYQYQPNSNLFAAVL